MAYIAVTNTLVNGNTADATEVNTNFTDITGGLSDGTKNVNMAAGTFSSHCTIGGNDAIKIYAYSSAVSAGDITNGYHDFTITAVTAAKVVCMSCTGYDQGSGMVYAVNDVATGYYTYARLTSTTTCRVYFDKASFNTTSDQVAVTIIVID